MESSPLPTPRHILTSIINTLTSTPIPDPSNEAESATNPLNFLPPSHRALLATLHVLIPPPTLLQALDLLDRRLVTRITPVLLEPRDTSPEKSTVINPNVGPLSRGQTQRNEGEAGSDTLISPSGTAELPTDEEEQQLAPQPQIEKRRPYPPQKIYQVQSSVPPKSRFSATSTGAGTRTYTVHLEVWNCNCAAFAFAAFPAGGDGLSFTPREVDSDGLLGDRWESSGERDEEREWEFGGLSLDGGEEQGVPCCKHLLACVLAERWEALLGRFVNHREVSLEEMAGLAVGE
ncbi:hypothetical protein B7463_g3661, partial [Scytalidium lignicola]